MDKSPISLSVIVPYYRKHLELAAVLPFNARYLGRPDVELVLVLDEPSEEQQVLELLDRLPLLNARVIVNDRDHEWRTPCVAINVGLRAALGQYVLVVSPESLFVGDVPSRVIRNLRKRPGDALLGRVAWTTIGYLRGKGPKTVFGDVIAAHGRLGLGDFYGSIAAARDLFTAVRGYDEALSEWGGDDDNIRVRLAMNGAMLVLDRGIELLHLSKEPRRHKTGNLKERMRPLLNPPSPQANPDHDWGREFGRIARDWIDGASSAPNQQGEAVPAAAVPIRPERLSTGFTGRSPGARKPLVAALFSFRYDAHLVDDLLANLAPVVDAWVSYDDRDSSALFSDEVARRQLLLRKAREIGADWVLAIDPDERVEDRLAEGIDQLTATSDRSCWSFNFRELYEPDSYRVDGIWGKKQQARLFPLRGDLMMNAADALHGRWCGFRARPCGFNLYHLKMIAPQRRQARSALYNHLDPERQFQRRGYDYLADTEGAEFETIPPGRGYSPPHVDDGGLWMPVVQSA